MFVWLAVVAELPRLSADGSSDSLGYISPCRERRKNALNATILHALEAQTAGVGHEEHLLPVSKIPLPLEVLPIAEGDLEPLEVAGLGWPDLRAGHELIRRKV